MSKMQELYEKVAADSALRAKFAEIMKEAEAGGEETAKEKLTVFTKEAGYEATLEEIQKFFKEMAEPKEGELSDAELDMVAGGKSVRDTVPMQSMVSNGTLTVCHSYSPNTSAIDSSAAGTCFKA